jgi:hypothetical protein
MHREFVGKGDVSGAARRSDASLNQRIGAFFLALAAGDDPAKIADDADESPAVRARVAFGRALLVLARSANHCVSLAKDLRHVSISLRNPGEEDQERREC